MADENQFDQPSLPVSPAEPETEVQPWNLVPVTADEHVSRQRRRKLWIAAVTAIAILLGVWIYKRNVDPIRALEAFDNGERLLRTARYSQAMVAFDRAISLRANYPEAFVMRGRAHIALGQPLEALPDFTQAIELQPRDPQPYLDRGSAHAALQEWKEALADFNHALDLDSKLAAAYNLRGSAVRAMGDPAKSLIDFERAVELLPNMDNLYQRGATYQMLGRHEEAISDFSRLISAEPSSAQAYFARAQSFRAIGDMEAAQRDHRIGRILDGK